MLGGSCTMCHPQALPGEATVRERLVHRIRAPASAPHRTLVLTPFPILVFRSSDTLTLQITNKNEKSAETL